MCCQKDPKSIKECWEASKEDGKKTQGLKVKDQISEQTFVFFIGLWHTSHLSWSFNSG